MEVKGSGDGREREKVIIEIGDVLLSIEKGEEKEEKERKRKRREENAYQIYQKAG